MRHLVWLLLACAVHAQTLTVTPSCGRPGITKVCVTGAGWAEPDPVCEYRFFFDATQFATQPDGLFGPPLKSFTVPVNAANGNHTVKVELRLSNAAATLIQQKDVPFKVDAPVGTGQLTPIVGAAAGGSGQSITTTYTPPPGCETNCKKIVFIQTVQRYGIKDAGEEVLTKSSDWVNFDADGKKTQVETTTDNRRVDQYPGLKSPYYNQNNGLVAAGANDGTGQVGSSGATQNNASIYDRPHTPAGTFPAGFKKAILRFEACAFCAEGDDAGKFLGNCFKWEQHQDKGALGTIQNITTSTGAPSAGFTAALAKWNTTKAFVFPAQKVSPCP